MTFQEFSTQNRMRSESPLGFNHHLESWSTSDWLIAALGELGEAANIAKKLNRIRDGVRGNSESEDELGQAFAQEIADTYIYLDLLAQSCDIDLGAEVVRVFNRKSKEIGYPGMIG